MSKSDDLASKLRQKVYIQKPVLVADGVGGYTRIWTDFAHSWAEIMPLQASESMRFEQISSQNRYRITLRYLEGVTPDMRILYQGQVFEIQAALKS